MNKIVFTLVLLIASLNVAHGLKKIEIKVVKDLGTLCETKTDKEDIFFMVVNVGKNMFEDCRIEKFKNGKWVNIEDWPECKALKPNKRASKRVVNDGSQVRLRAASGWGTRAWCHALDGRP